MLVREVLENEKEQFNRLATHPMQSWEWGEFRKKTGVKVVRLGVFDKNQLTGAFQVTFHPLPIPVLKTDLTIAYFPKGAMPDQPMLEALQKLGQKEKAVFIRLEPNVGAPLTAKEGQDFQKVIDFLTANGCQPGKPLFTQYTLRLELTKTERQFLEMMKPKTRYNLKIAQKAGVEVIEDNSDAAFETYLKLLAETTSRQKFYAHTQTYHRQMWSCLRPAGIAHLFLAKHQGKVLAAWILFVFNQKLYYPYGASSREERQVMPVYLLMWEAIRFGQRNGCKTFDLWGSLGPNPDPKDPWFGFHRFKLGFGAELIKFLGTYDLVIDHRFYTLVRAAENTRGKLLRIKARYLPWL